jgi:2-polyprenyl-3-methyl-5-hydroxy-6-metoxy-1,4-benzoquinol methylase
MSFVDVQIDRVKDYWNARPCNIRHSTQPVGTREYFDEVEARKYLVEPHIPAFADFARWRDKKVLEIGCGIGTDTINFARHGAQVTTVDLSDKSMALARQRAQVFGLQDRIRFCPGNAEELSAFVPVEPYDLIYSFGVIHHTPHPNAVLEQLRQYTHPRTNSAAATTLKIMVYYKWSWKVGWIIATEGRGQFWKLDSLVAKSSEAQTGCPITYTYSRASGKALLERHGFKVTGVAVDHIFPYRISDYVHYRYIREPYFAWMPLPMFRALERRLGWHLLLTATA